GFAGEHRARDLARGPDELRIVARALVFRRRAVDGEVRFVRAAEPEVLGLYVERHEMTLSDLDAARSLAHRGDDASLRTLERNAARMTERLDHLDRRAEHGPSLRAEDDGRAR